MDISLIVMGVGIFFIILSFFFKDPAKRLEKELEDLSINIYQETNGLKRRLKMVEEELLLEPNFKVQPAAKPKPPSQQAKPSPMTTFQQVAAQVQAEQAKKNAQQPTQKVHSILMNQVLELNKQGLTIEEISRLSTLPPHQVKQIIENGGL